jgi:hypothetical protein
MGESAYGGLIGVTAKEYVSRLRGSISEGSNQSWSLVYLYSKAENRSRPHATV